LSFPRNLSSRKRGTGIRAYDKKPVLVLIGNKVFWYIIRYIKGNKNAKKGFDPFWYLKLFHPTGSRIFNSFYFHGKSVKNGLVRKHSRRKRTFQSSFSRGSGVLLETLRYRKDLRINFGASSLRFAQENWVHIFCFRLMLQDLWSDFNQLIFPCSHPDLLGVGKLNVPVHLRINGSKFIPAGLPIPR
jgi:hypothetical protein